MVVEARFERLTAVVRLARPHRALVYGIISDSCATTARPSEVSRAPLQRVEWGKRARTKRGGA